MSISYLGVRVHLLLRRRTKGEAHLVAVGVLLVIIALYLIILVYKIIIGYLRRALVVVGG